MYSSVELLVVPDPDQGLADQGASVVPDVKCGYPAANSLFAVGHGDDLLPLERQPDKASTLDLGAANELRAPPGK